MRTHDQEVIRALADRWMELADLPVMEERKRQWTALKDLKAERPMVLFETWTLENYVTPDELQCEEPSLRNLEHRMRWVIRHAEEVGDDIVVEPCWRIGWHVRSTDYGVPIRSHHAEDAEGGHIGYSYDHPIRTPDDIDKLKSRTWEVGREATQRSFESMQELFGDILPVVLHGTTSLHAGLTGDLFRLVGNDNLLVWVYDEPEAIHRIMAYLRDDRLAYFDWLEAEGLLGLNSNSTLVGSGSPGYTTVLPQQGGSEASVQLRDLWAWVESQETTSISPAMFTEFFLPYMAEVASRFGLVYYGCCEPVHDRWQPILQQIPHVRAVSISPWCDMVAIAEMLGKSVVFSRKPWPAPISGMEADWETLGKDVGETLNAARDCNLEILFRDVYRIGGDRTRLRRWTDMVRGRLNT